MRGDWKDQAMEYRDVDREAQRQAEAELDAAPKEFSYAPWRHGGWYVHGVRYPGGAVGCVSRNYPDKKWRIVCDPRPFEQRPTFKCRDDAARAEWHLARAGQKAKP